MEGEVVEARLGHALRVAKRLPPATLAEAAKRGLDPRQAVTRYYRDSRYRRALRIGTEIIAIGGVLGPLLSDEAGVWLMVSGDAAKHHAKSLVKACKTEFARLALEGKTLVAYVVSGDAAAERFVQHFGFRLDAPGLDGLTRAVCELPRSRGNA